MTYFTDGAGGGEGSELDRAKLFEEEGARLVE